MYAAVFLVCVAATSTTLAIPLEDFYPFGITAGDAAVGATLDGSSEQQTLDEPFLFFGSTYSTLYVSTQYVCKYEVYNDNHACRPYFLDTLLYAIPNDFANFLLKNYFLNADYGMLVLR